MTDARMTAEREAEIRDKARACGPMGEDLRLCGDAEVKDLLAELDAVKADRDELQRGLAKLAMLGGGRSEGNLIAQETLAKAAALSGQTEEQ